MNILSNEYLKMLLHANLPARLTCEQVAENLGFKPHDIPILIANRLLKPLGKPEPNASKYFASVQIMEKKADQEWLDKASLVISRHWKEKITEKGGEYFRKQCGNSALMDLLILCYSEETGLISLNSPEKRHK